PVSAGSKRKGISRIETNTERKMAQPKTKKQAAIDLHLKNMSVVLSWSSIIGIDSQAAADHDAARLAEIRRHRSHLELQSSCQDLDNVESLLKSM
ncbi:hypothetical protein B5P41_33945, partial [Bacillus sp. SRB_28]